MLWPSARELPGIMQRKTRMTSRILRHMLAVLLLLAGTAHGVGEEAELKRLQSVLGVVNQEIQAAYQQYQTVLQLRSDTLKLLVYGAISIPDPVNFEAFKEEQRKLVRRDQELTNQLDQLLAQIRELEARKQPILQRIYQLVEESATAAPRPAPPAEAPAGTPIAPPQGY